IRPAASLIIASPITVNNSVSSFTTSNSKHEQGSAGCNYRILMMKRNASSFINAHVYPGGVIDRADHYSHWGHFLTNKICAIRETFEESGLLLSDPPLTQLTGSSKASFLNSLPTWRQKVHHDASQFKVMCETFNIRPAVDSLIPFSNWITPVIEKKRYDTMFFLTVLDQYTSAEEEAKHLNLVSADGKETVLFDWFTPEEAL
ncbi:hypothetical protein BDF20DRAFT_797878, partial [Mycotypha africana]|uniref:uncharacterized protein n=1 Tax=Mycotypha africana TaxID=64632 RepID=UPI0023005E2B